MSTSTNAAGGLAPFCLWPDCHVLVRLFRTTGKVAIDLAAGIQGKVGYMCGYPARTWVSLCASTTAHVSLHAGVGRGS